MTHYYAFFRGLVLAAGLYLGTHVAARAQLNCPLPIIASVSNVSATSVAITFSGNGFPVTLVYAPLGASPGTGTTIPNATSPLTLTGLSPTTTYQVYLQTICSATSQSTQVGPLNFSINCAGGAVATYPYSEDFNSSLPPVLPCDYAVLDVNGDGCKWSNPTNTPGVPSNGPAPYAMRYTYNALNPANDWFFTRGLQMQAGMNYQLQFKYRAGSISYPEGLEVKIGTAATIAGQTQTLFTHAGFTHLSYLTTTPGSSAGQVASFSPATSGVYYLGFHAISQANMLYLYVDDIQVTASAITATKSNVAPGFRAEASPVPFGEQLNLSLNALQAGPLQLTLHDAVGRVVRQHSTTVPAGACSLAVPEAGTLPAGVYLLTVRQGGNTQVIRVAHE